MKKTLKFGGTSLASPETIKLVKDIINSTEGSKYIVVSAPGKRFKDDTKVTDLLIGSYNSKNDEPQFCMLFNKISERFKTIIEGLKLPISIDQDLSAIKANIKTSTNASYAASRGEYLMGKIMAEYLSLPFIDSVNLIKFNKQGIFNYNKSAKLIETFTKKLPGAVIPGYYGACGSNGSTKIFTFTRSGSDYTGSVVAAATNSEVYENWTDVNGFLTADPKIAENAKFIEELSFRSLRDLSYMGAGVLHSDCVFPLVNRNIPIIVKNTFNPDHSGTKIVESVAPSQKIDGITGKKNLIKIVVEKSMLKSKLKAISQLLSVLKKYNLVLEHILASVDSISVVIEEKYFSCIEQDLIDDINRILEPNNIIIKKDIAIIAVAGNDLTVNENYLPKVFSAILENHIKIRMIDYGSSKSNILIGVQNTDFETVIKNIHKSLFE